MRVFDSRATEDFLETKEIKSVVLRMLLQDPKLLSSKGVIFLFNTEFSSKGFCVPYLPGVKGEHGPPGPRVSVIETNCDKLC